MRSGRPQNPVVKSKTDHKGYEIQLQSVDQVYQLTYDHRIALIRSDRKVINCGFKYVKTCWSTRASAINAVRKYNRFYNTTQFGFIEVDMFGNPEQGVAIWPKSKNK